MFQAALPQRQPAQTPIVQRLVIKQQLPSQAAVPTPSPSYQPYETLQWNFFANLHRLDSFVAAHPMTALGYATNPAFLRILAAQLVPDAQGSLIDQDLRYLYHPDPAVRGANLIDLDSCTQQGCGRARDLVSGSFAADRPNRGFYTWYDGEEKFLLVSPLAGRTADNRRLAYAYGFYTRSAPPAYLAALREFIRASG